MSLSKNLFNFFLESIQIIVPKAFKESLVNLVELFLTCYVIKGQSYPALQKLTRFTETIRENLEIWQTLNISIKTSEILEINNPPALKTVINEIFLS